MYRVPLVRAEWCRIRRPRSVASPRTELLETGIPADVTGCCASAESTVVWNEANLHLLEVELESLEGDILSVT